MGSRRHARELAMQFLYSFELNPGSLEENLEQFWAMNAADGSQRAFTAKLVRGTIEHLDTIDALIRRYTLNWELDRIALIDCTCLRVALYEMLYDEEIPPVVSINEAVDIAKRFSTAESGKFVNGILDKIRAEELA